MDEYGFNINLEVVKGGFILTYPKVEAVTPNCTYMVREIFSSPRKLQVKIKEVLSDLSSTPETAEGE